MADTNGNPVDPVTSSETAGDSDSRSGDTQNGESLDSSKVEVNGLNGAEEPAEPEKIASYHDNADLSIRVPGSGTNVQFNVCSALVSAASPALSTAVEPKKDTATENVKSVTEVAELGADSYGLGIVLSIIHYKFHDIPSRPDVDQLHSIARVADKYDCAHLLVPFMKKWMAGLEWHLVMNKEKNDDDKTLYLTWVFGEARWFTRMLSKVIHKAALDENGDLLDAHGQPWKDHGIPSAIVDLITKARANCLNQIVRAIDGPLQELMGGSKELIFCRAKDSDAEFKQSCQHQQLGSLVSALSVAGLLPFPTASGYRGSVADLAEKVRAIKVARFKLPNTPPHLDSHSNCGIHHEEAIDGALCEESTLTEEIIQELELRAHKSGASASELIGGIRDTEA